MREGPPTNGMQRTRNEQAFYHRRFVRAADAGRSAAYVFDGLLMR